jgi:hypothetical protein
MGLSRQMENAENFMNVTHFALLERPFGYSRPWAYFYLRCNKIPHYEKYYHYVENCLFTPIYLPRILPIE